MMKLSDEGRSEYGIGSGRREVEASFRVYDGAGASRQIVITGLVGPLVEERKWTARTVDRRGPVAVICEAESLSMCAKRVLDCAETEVVFFHMTTGRRIA